MAFDGRLTTAGIAIALIVMGVVTIRHQKKAASCPRHCHTAGRISVVAGWISLIGGIGILTYTLLALDG